MDTTVDDTRTSHKAPTGVSSVTTLSGLCAVYPDGLSFDLVQNCCVTKAVIKEHLLKSSILDTYKTNLKTGIF